MVAVLSTITPLQALLSTLVAVGCAVIGFSLLRTKRATLYPVRAAASVSFGLAVWILLNVLDDTSTSVPVYYHLSQTIYAYSGFILLNFLYLALRFPPLTRRPARLAILTGGFLLTCAVAVLVFHPAGLVVRFSDAIGDIVIQDRLPYFWIVLGIFCSLLATSCAVLLGKMRHGNPNDRRAVVLIVTSFAAVALTTMAMVTVDALNNGQPYLLPYAYYGMGLFVAAMGYAITKYGALASSLNIQRRVVSAMVLAFFVALIGVLAPSLRRIDISVLVLAWVSVTLAVVAFFIIEQTRSYPDLHAATDGPLRPSAEFSAWIAKRLGLTRAHWKPGTDIRGTAAPAGSWNNADVSSTLRKRVGGTRFDEAGPERTAGRIATSRGTLVVGRKRYNIALSEEEVRSLLNWASLHAAALELRALRDKRSNHLSEITALADARSRELERANRKLYEKLRKRSKFFKSVAAELRTPLTVVVTSIDSGAVNVPQEQASAILDAARKLKTLTQEFTQGTGAAAEQVAAGVTSLADVCENMERQYLAWASSKQIELHTSVTPLGAKTSISRIHIERALDNLVSNALKYSPAGTHVWINAGALDGSVQLAVEDEGPGIKQEDRELIFEPFFRTREAGAVAGTGLGLAAVKHVAEAHGGDVRVEPRVPRGSRFVVTLREPALVVSNHYAA
ncbi:MAG: ATP-binding protein [Candidatus Andersenbacteria bacterium]